MNAQVFDAIPQNRLQPFKLIPATEWAKRPPPNWIVPGFLLEKSLAIVYGESGCGKSFLMSHVSHVLAAGCGWNDEFLKRGCVVYFGTENPGSLSPRFKAMQNHLEGDFGAVYMVAEELNLLDPDTGRRLAMAIREAQNLSGLPVQLVVVDTFRDAHVGNEDSSQDIAKAFAPLKAIRDNFETTVCLVHHSGHGGERERGSSHIRANVDTAWQVAENNGTRTVSCQKMRDCGKPDPFGFELKPTPDGQCYVELCAPAEKQIRPRRLSDQNRLALTALKNVLALGSEPIPMRLGFSSDIKAARCEAWRAELYSMMGNKDQAAKRQAYNRALDALQAKGFIGCRDEWVWIIRDHV